MRVGIGVDMHRLVSGRPLVLGGVEIPHPAGLDGDSDADVVVHAIIDALLGAGGAGDIGQRFGVGDPRYRGISSLILLKDVVGSLREQGLAVGHVDATVIAEAPRLAAHIPEMRARIAEGLDAEVTQVSVKATTAKGLGFLGAREGIAAMAVASLVPLPAARRAGPAGG